MCCQTRLCGLSCKLDRLKSLFAPSCRYKETIKPYMAEMEEVVLQGDTQPSAGLSFHLADIAVPELLAAARQLGQRVPDAGVRVITDAFAAILARTQRATFPARLRCSFCTLLSAIIFVCSFQMKGLIVQGGSV